MAPSADNHYPSDEIDLRELMQKLWTSKWLIIVTTLIVMCIAAAYAFLSPSVYQTSVYTLPPTASDLASYNVASLLTGDAIRGTVSDTAAGINPLSSQEAYRTFQRHLNSSAIRQRFFDEYYLPAQKNNQTEREKQRAWKRLNNELTIQKIDEYETRLIVEGNNPQAIAKWANAYVALAAQAAREELHSGLTGEVEIRRLSLEDQIATLRQVAEEIRQARLTRLKDALAIAESIGLETPADGMPLIAINTRSDLNADSSGSLLYLRGAKALRSEQQQLEKRRAHDAYIPELPDLLKKQALLNSINLNPDLLSVATIDRAAMIPEEPIKPQKTLVLLLGFIFGGTLGIFFALTRILVISPKQWPMPNVV